MRRGRGTPRPAPTTLDLVPLAFEATGPGAGRRNPTSFRAKGAGYELYLDRGAATLTMDPAGTHQAPGEARREPARTVSFRLVGARKPAGEGLDPLAARANYFVGDDPKNWRREVPLFGRVRFEGVYPGVDLVYHGAGRELEHDFVVAPGGRPPGHPLRRRWRRLGPDRRDG